MNGVLSFIYGVLVKIVDDIYDNNFLLKYKYFFVTTLLLLTAYIIFFTNYCTRGFGHSWLDPSAPYRYSSVENICRAWINRICLSLF